MKVRMNWTYQTPKKQTVFFQSDELEAELALLMAEDMERTGRTKSIEFTDARGVTWSKKEMLKLMEELEYEPASIMVYFDGSYDKESGKSGAGAAIYYKLGKERFRVRISQTLDELPSNNEAEYAALLLAVNYLAELGVSGQEVLFKGDSLVAVNQLSGEWPCYEEQHQSWINRIEEGLMKLKISGNYEAIPRKENKEADQLSKQAIQGMNVRSRIKLD
ncbi:reverse transcriptase-like protein [Bacillus sp. FJAT-42376]|uniref:reverse transcriptase-like protein n=1 Tax=Bacillus sp. FJAT-42376 TaxID=2014076 RepID=UPI000F5048D9|nr:reverse transcriptase-like protein [Bacillus sp. FJAT-42376]AZB43273.1 reverse transcriptase-like protein [Bacillus sp. FJAT-42376]